MTRNIAMSNGFSHVGVSTHDMDSTIHFYQDILGFRCVIDDRIRVVEGGNCRHVFFDVGAGQSIGFLEPKNVPGFAAGYDAGINRGLGVPHGVYHYAFKAASLEELGARRVRLEECGVAVSPVVDLGPGSKSIYFRDPNGIQLEFNCQTQAFGDSIQRKEFEASMAMFE